MNHKGLGNRPQESRSQSSLLFYEFAKVNIKPQQMINIVHFETKYSHFKSQFSTSQSTLQKACNLNRHNFSKIMKFEVNNQQH